MPKVTIVGKKGRGFCKCHKRGKPYITTFITGATQRIEGKKVVTVGSKGLSTCGHTTVALTGSPKMTSSGNKVHRIGDKGKNCGAYVVITSSNTTTSD